MTDDFKKWLEKKSGVSCAFDSKGLPVYNTIALLIKAMWAINQDRDCRFWLETYPLDGITVTAVMTKNDVRVFNGKASQQALEAALKYIMEQTKQ